MSIVELSGTSRDSTSASLTYFQKYSNGMLRLSPQGEQLLSFIPTWMQNGANVRNLQEALGVEFERVLTNLNDVADQLYAESATWGLQLWEEMLGLPVQNDLSPDGVLRRRTLVLTALARESFTSEAYFQSGIALLAGVDPEDVVITPHNPRTAPYSWHVAVPITYFEQSPISDDVVATPAVGGGSVPVETYTYKIAYRYASGLTSVSAETASVVLGSVGSVVLSNIPIASNGALARVLFRKEAGGSEWTRVGEITNNYDTIFTDTAAAGTTAAPEENAAKTEQAVRVEKFIRDTKPAHLHITSSGVGFQADIDSAGDPV